MRAVKAEKRSSNFKIPFLVECNILALLPPPSGDIPHKFYSAAIQLAIIFGFVNSMYGKQSPILVSFSAGKLVDHLSNVFLTLTSITTTALTVFCYPNKMRKIFGDINKFDTKFKSDCNGDRGKLFWLCYLLFHIVIAVIISFDAWVWISSVGYDMYKYYIFRKFQYYQLNVTLMLIFWMTLGFRHRFKVLNDLLSEMLSEFYVTSYVSRDLLESKMRQKELKNIAKMYNFLCDIVGDFNAIFGVVILLAVLFFIALMVQYTATTIMYAVDSSQFIGASLGLSSEVNCFLWLAGSLLTLMAIAASGDRLIDEASKTTVICFNALNEIHVSANDVLTEEVKLIAQQTFCRRPCLSASGFFVVNYTMIGFIVASVTSYIIVVIQFKD